MSAKPVTIVIPVYADWPSLSDCLDSLFETVDTSKHKVMLVNDSGPEADELEKGIGVKITGQDGYEYYRNPKNVGFGSTCNRAALELDKTNNDILLLNSDTITTPGWLEEMTGVLEAESSIGTVSPRSNNATIGTVPLTAMPQKGLAPAKAYRRWKRLAKKLPRYNEIPTGLGFCLLVRRTLIKKYGLFDKIYGRGYAEENDLSMRFKSHGYKSVLANRAFIYHLEARSFTNATKAELLKKNRAILDKRYPEYTQLVRDYIKEALVREEGGRWQRAVKNPARALKKLIR